MKIQSFFKNLQGPTVRKNSITENIIESITFHKF